MTFTDETKAELAKPLNPKHVKPPAPGKYGEYIEGWRVIDEANRIFGFDGWTRETMYERCVSERETMMGRDKDKPGWAVAYIMRVRVTAAGIVREGCGAGTGVDADIGAAHESAYKEAETDAMKRALMTFGNPFGLALYDKSKANVGSDVELINNQQCDRIQAAADKARVSAQAICEQYGIDALTSLPIHLYDVVMESLRLTIEKRNAAA